MLKARRILSALLTSIMCFSIVVPAFGAEKTNVATMDYINDTEAILSVGEEEIAVKAYDNMEIDQAGIQDFYQRMLEVKAQEMPSPLTRSAQQVDCFEYSLMTDEATYLYDESEISGEKHLYVFETQQLEAVEEATQEPSVQPMANLEGGIGGRVNLNTSYGDYISGTIQTPLKSQVSGTKTELIDNYVYTGFEGKGSSGGSIATDIGLQYTTKESIGGWNHYFLININGNRYTVDKPSSGYADVNDKNFFLTSDANNTRNIAFTTYKNYNNSGYVRSKLEGYARYDSSTGGTPGAYYKISVKESNKKVASITKWKLLNTFTSETAKNLKSWCKFSNITLNGGKPSQSYITIDKDYATVSPVYSGGKLSSVTISVSK